jgi:GT2 family glycosyltransferase
MNSATFTVVMLQRERFSITKTSLESLLASRESEYPLILMDGSSPPEISEYLRKQSKLHRLDYLYFSHFLTHNKAINLILPRITTPYVLFCDNDLLFSKGWAEILVRCAQESGAHAVMPLYLEEDRSGLRIHMAGGYAWAENQGDQRHYHEEYWLMKEPLSAVHTLPQRYPVQFLEYHAFCVHSDTLRKIGSLDENLTPIVSHVDFSLVLGGSGKKILADRTAQVTYLRPPPIRLIDRTFFTQTWSEAWINHNMAHFSKKWQVVPLRRPWFSQHRQLWLLPRLLSFAWPLPLKLREKLERLLIRLGGKIEEKWNVSAIPDLSAFGPLNPVTPTYELSALPSFYQSRETWMKAINL